MSQSESNLAWAGVMPAVTTPFNEHGSVDHAVLARHAEWLVEEGCTGIVACGSLGEGGSLSIGEKAQIFSTCATAVGRKVPVIAAVSASTTKEAVEIAKVAQDHGCSGLMVLPPYVYVGDWREMKAHVGAVLSATKLSAMLYNNPIAYNVDFLPHQVVELQSEHGNLNAIKESSADVRRIAALRELAGDAINILVGVDDLIVEAVLIGADGLGRGPGERVPEGVGRSLQFSEGWQCCRSDGTLQVVSPSAPNGHSSQVCPANQSRAGGDWPGFCSCPGAAS
jgi:dihydrodipicolinate synthase/N-acetylneuraminate lyase